MNAFFKCINAFLKYTNQAILMIKKWKKEAIGALKTDDCGDQVEKERLLMQ